MRYCILGAVPSVSSNIMNLCLSTTAIVANSKIQSMKETLSHILVDKFVEGKEGLIVHIHVLNFATKENANHASMKALLWHVSAEKVQELLSAVNRDKFSNAVKNVKGF